MYDAIFDLLYWVVFVPAILACLLALCASMIGKHEAKSRRKSGSLINQEAVDFAESEET